MDIVKQTVKKVAGVLLLHVRVVLEQEAFKDLLSTHCLLSVLGPLVDLLCAIEVPGNFDELLQQAVRLERE